MTTLRELQAGFAAAIGARDADPEGTGIVAAIMDDGLPPAARLSVYRNNSRAMFETALERTYAVLRRRVGDGYFRRLAAEYRVAHPSASGDLQWVGAAFPDWLDRHLAGNDYAWLADLARLEWACEQALIAAESPALGLEALGRVPPEALVDIRLALQPHLRLVSSAFPVWSVWRANQVDGAGSAVDLSLGPEHVVVGRDGDQLALRCVTAAEHAFIDGLARGATLGAALEGSTLAVEVLPATLGWLFGDGLVIAVHAAAPDSRP